MSSNFDQFANPSSASQGLFYHTSFPFYYSSQDLEGEHDVHLY